MRSKVLLVFFFISLGIMLLFPLLYTILSTQLGDQVSIVFGPYSLRLLAFAGVSYMNTGLSMVVVFILLSMGISIFIGGELNSGAIRNQVTAGFSRTKIYYAYLIAVLSVPLAAIIAGTIIIFGIGIIANAINPTDLFETLSYPEFYARYIILLIAFMGFLALVFNFAIRFNNRSFPMLMGSLIIPMSMTIGPLIMMMLFLNIGGYDTAEEIEQFTKTVSWFPSNIFNSLISANPTHLGNESGLNGLMSYPYMSLENYVIIKGAVFFSLFSALSIVSGHLLFKRREFK